VRPIVKKNSCYLSIQMIMLCIVLSYAQPQGFFKYFNDSSYNPGVPGLAEITNVYVDYVDNVWVTGRFGISIIKNENGLGCGDSLELLKRGYATCAFPLTDSSIGVFWAFYPGMSESLLEYNPYTYEIVSSKPFWGLFEIWCQTKSGELIFGGGSKFYKFKNDSLILISDSTVIPGSDLQGFAVGLDSSIWAATFKGGLLRYKNEKWTRYDTLNSILETNQVSDVAVGPDGVVWASTRDATPVGGLYKFDGVNWQKVNNENLGGSEMVITRMGTDGEGGVWMRAERIMWFSNETFYTFNIHEYTEREIPTANILSMYQDKYGNIWFGMLHNGVHAYFPKGNPCCDTCTSPNLPPEMKNVPDTVEIDESQTFKDTITATDPENDPITYTFQNVPPWGSASDSILTLNPTANDDSVTITVIASDGKGGADTADIFFEVTHPTSSSIKRTKNNTNLFTFTIDSQTLTFPNAGLKEIVVLDMQGRQVRTFKQPKSSVFWDGIDLRGNLVPSGSYLVKAVYSEKRRVKSEKIVLMR